MRTLQLYSGNLYGGVETTIGTIARQSQGGDTIREFGLCFDGRLRRELDAAHVPLHVLGEVHLRRPLTVWRARRRLRALLSREPFDVVICHSAWSQVIFGPVVRRAGVPLVFWLHDAATGTHWLERWARRTPPDLVICNSHFTGRTAPAMYPQVCVEVLHPPLDDLDRGDAQSARAAVRRERGIADATTVIIQVSRMEPYKGHRLHLEALAGLRDLQGRWESWFVGGVQRPHEQRYLDELRNLADTLGVAEHVRFLGQRDDVPSLLAAADIHCQPNVRPEPFGITFVEALAAGLPVVTPAFGGAVEIVDTSCGILVPPGDVKALSAALRRLVQDPVLRREIGRAGPARARKLCDPATQVRRLDDILASMVRTAA